MLPLPATAMLEGASRHGLSILSLGHCIYEACVPPTMSLAFRYGRRVYITFILLHLLSGQFLLICLVLVWGCIQHFAGVCCLHSGTIPGGL